MRGRIYTVSTAGVAIFLTLLFVSISRAAFFGSYWVGANTFDSVVTGQDVQFPNRQCDRQTISVMNDDGLTNRLLTTCIADTAWGSISDDGYVRKGKYGSYSKLLLPSDRMPLLVAGSDKIYFQEPLNEHTFKAGDYGNFETNFSYDGHAQAYITQTSPYYFERPGTTEKFIFHGVGFSNDGRWLVGALNNEYVRIQLSDQAMNAFGEISAEDANDAFYTPSISNDGQYISVTGGNYWKLDVYDMFYCSTQLSTDLWNEYPYCAPKNISDDQSGGSYPSNALFTQAGKAITLNVLSDIDGPESIIVAPHLGLGVGMLGVGYVALGDSFSSGEGDRTQAYITGTDGTSEFPNEKCHQSTNSYPFFLASSYDMGDDSFDGNMESMTCSGARSKDILSDDTTYIGEFSQISQSDTESYIQQFRSNALLNFTPGRIPQQDFVSRYKPRIITLGIGGNDVGFKDVLSACAQPGTCAQATTRKGEEASAIKNEYNTLVKIFNSVMQQSQGSKLYVVGYPQIFTTGNFCGYNVLLDGTERRFVRESTTYMNQIIKAAATHTGAVYVDIENAFGNDALCGSGRAVNGLVLGNDVSIPIGGFDPKLIGQESYHPTAFGHQLTANYISDHYGSLLDYHDPKCSEFFLAGRCADSDVTLPNSPRYFGSQSTVPSGHENFTKPYSFLEQISIFLKNFAANTLAELKIFSTPQSLGTFTTDATGQLNTSVTLPVNLPYGYHTLVLTGELPTGETVNYEQGLVYADPNNPPAGACGFIPASGIDEDGDVVDDACDGTIDTTNPTQLFSAYDDSDESNNSITGEESISSPGVSNNTGGSTTVATTNAKTSGTLSPVNPLTSNIKDNNTESSKKFSIIDKVPSIAVQEPAKFIVFTGAGTLTALILTITAISSYRKRR